MAQKKAASGMSAFDAIATNAPKATASKTVKVAAQTTKGIREAVDRYTKNKAQLKTLEAAMAQDEALILDHVRPQQDKLAYTGDFTKSMVVEGTNGTLVTMVTSDKFSALKDPNIINEVKAIVKDLYETFLKKIRTITVRAAFAEDGDKIDKLVAACQKAGIDISEAFEVVDVVKALPDLDRNQYKLKPDQLEIFRTLVKQAKPALK